jgi:hypothetical protein
MLKEKLTDVCILYIIKQKVTEIERRIREGWNSQSNKPMKI